MKKVLVNDGIEAIGKAMMEEAGLVVVTERIAQEDLVNQLPSFDAICVRSATKVRKDLIDACPNLKAIGRGGVGMDNIDVDYAKQKGIAVVNTPAASSRSVAELSFAHLLTGSRYLHQSNRDMPTKGVSEFGKLKKSYAEGVELKGKTLGVIGMGRIGQEAIKIGIGMDMKIIAHDPYLKQVSVVAGSSQYPINATIDSSSLEDLLAQSDFITLHVPSVGKALLGREEFAKMKKGVMIANAARGGVIDEEALLDAIESGIVFFAGLDVFENEPTPDQRLLDHPQISVTPHIGASTNEAQNNIGIELAQQIIEALS